MNSQESLDLLRRKRVRTWFELGIFLDKLLQRSSQLSKNAFSFSDFQAFQEYLGKGSLGFVTYKLDVDGVSIEIRKYLDALRGIFGHGFSATIFAGDIAEQRTTFLQNGDVTLHTIEGAKGFEDWGELYFQLFYNRLERGNAVYNNLPKVIWEQSIKIAEQLIHLIEKGKVRCLLPVNVASNPGNISLTLAVVFVSEVLGLPVLNLNHDYYWEDGKPDFERGEKEPRGVRDHFFTNYHLGEVFSVIRLLYPWNGRYWMHANINSEQSQALLSNIGINPSVVVDVPTAIDFSVYKPLDDLEKEKTFLALNLSFRSIQPNMRAFSSRSRSIRGLLREGKPFLVGAKSLEVKDFSRDDTVVFLQPTRIIERKHIEDAIAAMGLLLTDKSYREFIEKEGKRVLLLITGPLASGREEYFYHLLRTCGKLFDHLPATIRERVFIGFKFGKDANEAFLSERIEVLKISQLYGISSLVFLLSSTEGRGLPILESAAVGIPLLVRPFSPERTYRQVIDGRGEKTDSLRVFEYLPEDSRNIWVKPISRALLFKDEFRNLSEENRAVMERRFSMEGLEQFFLSSIKALWFRTGHYTQERKMVNTISRKFDSLSKNGSLKQGLLFAKNRMYIPGYIPLRFMFALRSLIDPSYFRIEIQELRSRVFLFALTLLRDIQVSDEKRVRYFRAIEQLFELERGRESIGVDHTYTFRYRTRRMKLFHRLTEQELFGVVVQIYKQQFGAQFDYLKKSGIKQNLQKVSSQCLDTVERKESLGWRQWLKLLASIDRIEQFFLPDKERTQDECDQFVKQFMRSFIKSDIDDRNMFLERVLGKPQPIVFFLGGIGELVVELTFLEKLIEHWLFLLQLDIANYRRTSGNNAPFRIFLVVRESSFVFDTTKEDLVEILKSSSFSILHNAWKKGLVDIVPMRTTSSSAHLHHLYAGLFRAMEYTKQKRGCVMAAGEDHYLSLDLLDIDRFHFGIVKTDQFSRYTGLEKDAFFFQFVPAGLRSVLNFPFPTQQASRFSTILQGQFWSQDFDTQLEQLKQRADQTGEDLRESLTRLSKKSEEANYYWKYISGKHGDGLPWTGVKFVIPEGLDSTDRPLFQLIKAPNGKKETVDQMVEKQKKRRSRKAIAAFNGGYILNNELVGKLGIGEEFIGSPLGLIMDKGRVECLPLFYRPVMAIRSDGSFFISRFSLPGGSMLPSGNLKAPFIIWKDTAVNKKSIGEGILVYTPMFSEKVPIKNRVLLTICGDRVAQIKRARYRSMERPLTKILPVGVTFSIPEELFDREYAEYYKLGGRIDFQLNFSASWDGVTQALEAGPLLVEDGKVVVDMQAEGWISSNSKKIQASRQDRTGLRGPRIGIGVTANGGFVAVAINSRTRDSFGVSIIELADILVHEGAIKAMALDPGGSTTLWIDGSVRNISPYNSNYQQQQYFASPEPRGVANGILISL